MQRFCLRPQLRHLPKFRLTFFRCALRLPAIMGHRLNTSFKMHTRSMPKQRLHRRLLQGCQTIEKVGRFCLPIKSANKNLSSVMQKSANKSIHFIVQHVLFLTIKSANFLDNGHHGDCLQWEMNTYLSYLFCSLLYDVYFRSLDAEKIMQVSFRNFHSAVLYP